MFMYQYAFPHPQKGGVYQQLYDQILIYRQMLTGGMWKTTVLLWTIWYAER